MGAGHNGPHSLHAWQGRDDADIMLAMTTIVPLTMMYIITGRKTTAIVATIIMIMASTAKLFVRIVMR